MKGLLVLGVTHISDSYPNVKYKMVALQKVLGHRYTEYVMPLNQSDASPGFFSEMSTGRFAFGWRLLTGHIKVLFYSLRHRAQSVYVCYPGIFLAAWLGLPFMRKRYPFVYLDAFISLYDTIVFDRRILKEDSFLAKLLYRLEKKAFEAASVVIVDTPENARFYSELLDIPPDKFYAMPLCIPPLLPNATQTEKKPSERVRCVFVGTFVPLQGIRTIVEAAGLLADDAGIDFVFVGDGQDGGYLQDYIANSPNARVTWHRGHYSTQFIIDQIVNADICLGIFGDGPKAQRVLPYKIYYYLALGMPIVTATSDTTERILAECRNLGSHAPFMLVPAGDAQSLADTLRHLRDDPTNRARTGISGVDYFRRALSDVAIRQSLEKITRAA
jgi:glycosyltransferase involved in cell wall biosynthesis